MESEMTFDEAWKTNNSEEEVAQSKEDKLEKILDIIRSFRIRFLDKTDVLTFFPRRHIRKLKKSVLYRFLNYFDYDNLFRSDRNFRNMVLTLCLDSCNSRSERQRLKKLVNLSLNKGENTFRLISNYFIQISLLKKYINNE